MIRFRLDGRPHCLPETWAELTGPQLLSAAPYLAADTVANRLAVVRAWCPKVRERDVRRLTPDQLWDLCAQVGWAWKLEQAGLTEFAHRGRTYLVVEPNLTDAVLVEYAMASVYFHLFARPKAPQATALDQLVATLCRPAAAGVDENDPAWDGQRRERYNGKLAEARAKELADLPLSLKMVVLHRFLAAERFIQRNYQDLYEKPAPQPEGPPAAAGPAPKGDGTQVLEILAELAETGTYGTYEQVCHTRLHTVFFNLAKKARRRREAEKQS
ncbi:hypothetical protein [Hymenobacter convexus]|uniref:hypothetical protein n=1 Tax=Hymenobacter sp. CA1UV-4 TaxID=3063782 RepID=UPI00271444F4|nr:hypothetical protein [Hymenobacter sp. CA1UV-4]MDO7851552.1 hypothetical protein [Hymenobacter sp. CA1UV-4]